MAALPGTPGDISTLLTTAGETIANLLTSNHFIFTVASQLNIISA